MTGAAALGDNRDELVHVFHGAGANGKTKFSETIRVALGDYAATVDAELFLAQRVAPQRNPSLRGCAASGSSPRPRPRKDAGSTWRSSKALTAARRSPRATSTQTTSSNSCRPFRPGCERTTGPRSATNRRRFGGASGSSPSPSRSRAASAIRRCRAATRRATRRAPVDRRRRSRLPRARPRDGRARHRRYRRLPRRGRRPRRFIADRCLEHPEYATAASVLYGAWRAWCLEHGEEPGSAKRSGFALRRSATRRRAWATHAHGKACSCERPRDPCTHVHVFFPLRKTLLRARARWN